MIRLSIISEHGPWILRLLHVTWFIDKKDTKLVFISAAIKHKEQYVSKQKLISAIYFSPWQSVIHSHVSKLDDGLI